MDKAGRAKRPRPAGEGLGRGLLLLLPQPWAPWLAPARVTLAYAQASSYLQPCLGRLLGPGFVWSVIHRVALQLGCRKRRQAVLAVRTEQGSF